MYGIVEVKVDTFPIILTPLNIINAVVIHANKYENVTFQFNPPLSSIVGDISNIYFLKK